MARFHVSPAAQRDIAEITEFIMRDNPVRALSFAHELRVKIAKAAQTPLAYRERTEIRPGIRAARHGKYLIFFRYDGAAVEVLRVWHSARDYGDVFQD